MFPQDIHGSAWFDDLTVSQVPAVTLFTDSARERFCAGGEGLFERAGERPVYG